MLSKVHTLREALEIETADHSVVGNQPDYGMKIDLDDALFGVIYTEKALSRLLNRKQNQIAEEVE